MNALSPNGLDVLEGLRELPGGAQLRRAAEARSGEVALIGGAVRDLLLERRPRELDVVVDEDAAGFARALADELGTTTGESPKGFEMTLHERFRTALVRWGEGQIDVATRRSERYPTPGSLPEVGAGTVASDLDRRDFTINTLSVALNGAHRGGLTGARTAREDLDAGLLRVLHDESFRDDPIRLMRMARYRARLDFTIEPHTAQVASDAIDTGALETVSPARIGAELRLALAEPDPVAALESLEQLGVLSALHEAIELDAPLTRAALAALPSPPDAWPDVLLLASLLRPRHSYDATDYQTRLRALLDGYEFPGPERERTVRSAILAPRIAERLEQASKASQIYAIAQGEPIEAIALGGAIAGAAGHGGAADAARRWLSQLRHVELEIGGEDLLAAGIAPGPEIGRRLYHALMRKLDDELLGAEDLRALELAAALEDA